MYEKYKHIIYEVEDSESGMQDVTKQTNSILNVFNNLTVIVHSGYYKKYHRQDGL